MLHAGAGRVHNERDDVRVFRRKRGSGDVYRERDVEEVRRHVRVAVATQRCPVPGLQTGQRSGSIIISGSDDKMVLYCLLMELVSIGLPMSGGNTFGYII